MGRKSDREVKPKDLYLKRDKKSLELQYLLSGRFTKSLPRWGR